MENVTSLIDLLNKNPKARTVTQIINPKQVIRVSRRFKPYARITRREYVVTIGVPNWTTTKIILRSKPLPVLDLQYEYYPKVIKKRKAK